ncbi:hypothetical protein [Flavobacterium sp.]|uniref:hypothetical protein n=1 Tax=Flavobacterium sp. TaxID=239 RepID=UPI0039E241D6
MKKLSSILLFFLIFGCREETEKQENLSDGITSEEYSDISENYVFKPYEDNKSYCTKILINSLKKSKERFPPFSPLMLFESTQISTFEDLLESSEKTSYCCCPTPNLEISFYNNNSEFDSYLVDTIEFKNKVRIFDKGYQFSYLVNKKKWKEYLKDKKIKNRHYRTSDLAAARKIYNICLENNLIVKNAPTVSKHWMSYDGEFTFIVEEKGKKIAEDFHLELKKKYSEKNFKTQFIYQKHIYNEDKSKYYQSRIELIIFCNKDFYNAFDLQGKKSKFRKTKADFFILGPNKKLEALPDIK